MLGLGASAMDVLDGWTAPVVLTVVRRANALAGFRKRNAHLVTTGLLLVRWELVGIWIVVTVVVNLRCWLPYWLRVRR